MLGWLTVLLSLVLVLVLAPAQAVEAHERPAKTQSAKAKAKAKAKAAKAKARAKAKAKAKARAKAKAQAKARAKAKAKAAAAAPKKLVLRSSVAYVIDTESDEVLLGKNAGDVRPIASLTKLMTGLIIAEADLPLDQKLRITRADVDTLKGSSSRLRVGTVLTRRQALHLALMSSENRAAHALARTYPGGERAFVSAMNNKARELGMQQTHFVEPTGLSSENQSSARDLAVLAEAAYEKPLLRRYTTSPGYQLATKRGKLRYNNTNRLVKSPEWDIGLQKTGYISEAGQCLLVQTTLDGRNLIMVFLDSASKISRIRDAENVRAWIKAHPELGSDDDRNG